MKYGNVCKCLSTERVHKYLTNVSHYYKVQSCMLSHLPALPLGKGGTDDSQSFVYHPLLNNA